MISLRLSTGQLVSITGGEIELTWESNLFTGNSIPGVLSYPFDIDATPAVLAALKYPTYLHSRNVIPEDDYPTYLRTSFYMNVHEQVELMWNGEPLMAGTLKLKGYKGNTIRAVFSGDAGHFSQAAKQQMSSLDYGGERTVSAASLAAFAAHMDAANLLPNSIPYRFPTLRDEYGDLVAQPNFPGYVNTYLIGSPTIGPGNWDFFIYPGICPFPLLRYITQQLFIENGWSVSSPLFLDTDYVKALLLYSPVYKREATYAATPIIDLALHVPNPFTVGEFINGLCNYFKLGIDFNSNRKAVTITPAAEILSLKSYDDYTSKAPPIRNLEFIDPEGYQFNLTADDADYYEPRPEYEYTIGNGERQISSSFSFLQDKIAIPAGYSTAFKLKTPVVKQSYDIYGPISGERTKFTPRLMFYRGQALRESPYPGDYPFATASDTDMREDLVAASGTTYTEKLNWGPGTRGVVEQWHRPWIDFYNKTRKAEATLNLTFSDLLNMDLTRAKYIDSAFFLISKMTVKLGRTIQPAQAEVYKIQ